MNNNISKSAKIHLAVVTGLTCSRAVLLFVFLALTACDLLIPVTTGNIERHLAARWCSFWVLIASAITDLFDGMLARKWGVTTKFGAVCDPLMDKIFYAIVFPTVTGLFFLDGQIRLGTLSLAFTSLHLVRDMWVVTLRSLAAGKADLKADFVGKLRTAVSFPLGIIAYLYIAIPLRILSTPQAYWGLVAFYALVLALNLYSAFSYTRRFAFAIAESLKIAALPEK